MATENNGFLNWLMNQFSNRMNPFGQGGLNRGIGMGIGALTGNPLLGMALSNVNFRNLGSTLSNAGRGLASSIDRMNDNDPSTGFFNNPQAFWNWGKPPSNVPEGHRDFTGPPNPFLGAQPKPGEQGYGVVASGGSGGGSGGRGSVQSSSGRMPGVVGGRLAGSSMIDLWRKSKWNHT